MISCNYIHFDAIKTVCCVSVGSWRYCNNCRLTNQLVKIRHFLIIDIMISFPAYNSFLFVDNLCFEMILRLTKNRFYVLSRWQITNKSSVLYNFQNNIFIIWYKISQRENCWFPFCIMMIVTIFGCPTMCQLLIWFGIRICKTRQKFLVNTFYLSFGLCR